MCIVTQCVLTQFTSLSEKAWMRHFGGHYHTALFSEVRILGKATFTCKPIDRQNGEHGTVAACYVCAPGQ